jgi:hypothetical protein
MCPAHPPPDRFDHEARLAYPGVVRRGMRRMVIVEAQLVGVLMQTPPVFADAPALGLGLGRVRWDGRCQAARRMR